MGPQPRQSQPREAARGGGAARPRSVPRKARLVSPAWSALPGGGAPSPALRPSLAGFLQKALGNAFRSPAPSEVVGCSDQAPTHTQCPDWIHQVQRLRGTCERSQGGECRERRSPPGHCSVLGEGAGAAPLRLRLCSPVPRGSNCFEEGTGEGKEATSLSQDPMIEIPP